jgi:inosine/xanthosine triphosphate pyrophosphatase family protein
MTLFFVTSNRGKLADAQAYFPEIKAINLDLQEPQSLDPNIIVAAKLS